MGVLKRQRSILSVGSKAGFVEEVAVCSFMHYLSNIFEGWQCAGSKDTKMNKIPACSWPNVCIRTYK